MGIGTNLKGLILGNDPVTSGPLPDLIPLDDRKIKKINLIIRNHASSSAKPTKTADNCPRLTVHRRQQFVILETMRTKTTIDGGQLTLLNLKPFFLWLVNKKRIIRNINSKTFLENKPIDSSKIKLAESRINCDFLPQSRPVRQCLFQIQTARLSLS